MRLFLLHRWWFFSAYSIVLLRWAIFWSLMLRYTFFVNGIVSSIKTRELKEKFEAVSIPMGWNYAKLGFATASKIRNSEDTWEVPCFGDISSLVSLVKVAHNYNTLLKKNKKKRLADWDGYPTLNEGMSTTMKSKENGTGRGMQ